MVSRRCRAITGMAHDVAVKVTPHVQACSPDMHRDVRQHGAQHASKRPCPAILTWNSLLDRTWLPDTPLITPAMSSFMRREPRGNWSTRTRTGPCLRRFCPATGPFAACWPAAGSCVPCSAAWVTVEGSAAAARAAGWSACAGRAPACSAACLASGAALETAAASGVSGSWLGCGARSQAHAKSMCGRSACKVDE